MSKFCLNCGAEIPDSVKFCTSCGKEVQDASAVEAANTIVTEDNFGLGDAPVAPEPVILEKVTDAEEIAPEPIPVMDDVNNSNAGAYSEQNTYSGNYGAPQAAEPAASKTLAIVSLVCGILSILCCCCCTYLGIALSIAAIACGVIVLVKNMEGRGMAIAGIACGGVGFVVLIIAMIAGAAMGSLANYEDIIEQIQDSL